MIAAFQEAAENAKDEYDKRRWLYRVESLARQIGDARLFEATRLASWGTPPSTAACLDIAQVHLENGDPESALCWLKKIPVDTAFQADKRDELLLNAYGQLGKTDEQTQTARRIFRRYRSDHTLEQLLSVIGPRHREAVIAEETRVILATKALSLSDAAFLLSVGRTDDAERYLLARANQLNGSQYNSMLSLAKAFESNEQPLAASMLYRAMLDSILDRGYSKAYDHAVRYLKKLEALAESIADWQTFDDHEAYMQRLQQRHRRKFSFWSKYEKASA